MNQRGNSSFQLTPITGIIGICVLLSVISLITPQAYNWLAMTPAYIVQQPWTFITSIFTHAPIWPSFYHLLFNMWMLYVFGAALSGFIGERKMLAVFFGGALVGNAFFLLVALFTPWTSPFSSVIGASGGVIALGGALSVLTPKTKVLIFGIVPAPLWAAVVGSFVVLSFFPGVAWQAHLGGLLLGAAAGYYFKRRLRQNYRW